MTNVVDFTSKKNSLPSGTKKYYVSVVFYKDNKIFNFMDRVWAKSKDEAKDISISIYTDQYPDYHFVCYTVMEN